MKKVICDAGHGGRDPGAGGHGITEKVVTLPLALETEKALLAGWEDIEVVLTRRRDEYVSIANRASFGRGADLFVSMHLDWNGNPAVRGFWTWRNTTVQQATPGYQKIIHEETYKALAPLGVPDRGLRTANHDITRLPPCPTVLIEYGFISNQADAAVFKSSANIAKVAQATAAGIAEALQLPRKSGQAPAPDPAPPVDSDVYFRVIIGSYKDRNNAIRAREEARAKGFNNAFIAAFRKQ